MLRFAKLKDLYDKLLTIETISDKIQLVDEQINITYHKDCIFSIKVKIYFSIFINNILCCGKVEDQDIWEVINSYFDQKLIFIEYKNFLGKRKIIELNQKQYEKQKIKFMRMQNVKIFNHKVLMFSSILNVENKEHK